MDDNYMHPTGDEALTHLSSGNSVGVSLVKAFPGNTDAEDTGWLRNWFRNRIAQHYDGLTDDKSSFGFDPPQEESSSGPIAPPVRLGSLQANYFRGFREMSVPIDMSGNLVVIDGPNSSGKTSLAESLEWLFTGSLSRRANSSNGNPRELEDCVQNQFRPEGVETWVKATFVSDLSENDSEGFTLRRVLTKDYGRTATSTCESVLFLDDQELEQGSEQAVLDKHFAGVPPLLMQHTLRDFVNSDPSRRRTYFERLLRLDELTELVRLSVISDDRLADFPSPHGTAFSSMWNELGDSLQTQEAKQAHNRALPNAEPVTPERIAGTLILVAKSEFPAIGENLEDTGQIIDALRTEQAIGRQNAFPLLGRLRPKRPIAEDAQHTASVDARETVYKVVREAWAEYEPARLAMQELGESNLAISQAFKILSDAGLIRHGANAQPCPLCAYPTAETLLHDRVEIVQTWEPIRSNEQNTRRRFEGALSSVVNLISEAVTLYNDVLPDSPSETEWETALSDVGDRTRDAVDELKQVINGREELSLVARNAKRLTGESIPAMTSAEECEAFIERCDNLLEGLAITPIAAKSYAEALTSVETAVGVEASLDPDYRLRERFILCDEKALEISESLKWERARKSAQRDLEKVREGLMSYRQQFLEARRQSFNTHIERIWTDLRKDRYSSFSHINIPRPSGRGFPVTIELKANLDDAETRQQVDVLKVFSESQVNALGVAAFVTRSKLLGHRMLVLVSDQSRNDRDRGDGVWSGHPGC